MRERACKLLTYFYNPCRQANVFLEFLPHRAPYVIMCIDDVSKPGDIQMAFYHQEGYHPYFMKHALYQKWVANSSVILYHLSHCLFNFQLYPRIYILKNVLGTPTTHLLRERLYYSESAHYSGNGSFFGEHIDRAEQCE